mmetsp:Transcript_9564/g.58252  ORF Transcript_9564/g.58252 Transcript_9564/m.58252 type:complete len:220 (+) Transcript_9564:270-929(+)
MAEIRTAMCMERRTPRLCGPDIRRKEPGGRSAAAPTAGHKAQVQSHDCATICKHRARERKAPQVHLETNVCKGSGTPWRKWRNAAGWRRKGGRLHGRKGQCGHKQSFGGRKTAGIKHDIRGRNSHAWRKWQGYCSRSHADKAEVPRNVAACSSCGHVCHNRGGGSTRKMAGCRALPHKLQASRFEAARSKGWGYFPMGWEEIATGQEDRQRRWGVCLPE